MLHGSQAPWYKADTLPAKCELVRMSWSFPAEWRCAREAEMKAIHLETLIDLAQRRGGPQPAIYAANRQEVFRCALWM